VRSCEDRIAYAQALASLEDWRGASGQWGLAATGGPLLGRIRRVLGPPIERRLGGEWFIGILLIVVIGLLSGAGRITVLGAQSQELPASEPPQETAWSNASRTTEASPSQVMIEIKFIELGQADMKKIGLSSLLAGSPAVPSVPSQITNRNG